MISYGFSVSSILIEPGKGQKRSIVSAVMSVEQVVGETGREAIKAVVNEMKNEKVTEKVVETVTASSGSFLEMIYEIPYLELINEVRAYAAPLDNYFAPYREQAHLVLDRIESVYPEIDAIIPFWRAKFYALPQTIASMWVAFSILNWP